jgi:uncharacterized protein YqgC (DUF456 family)
MTQTLLIVLTSLLCLIGLLLSMLAFSGTWLVLLAAVIAALSSDVPGLPTLITFALLCIATEIIEAVAGYLGVQKRGGSKLAGLASLIGGLVGAMAGSAILPVIGTVLGILLGSFAFAFLIEYRASGKQADAAHIARGAVLARLCIMTLKTVVTAIMSTWLLFLIIQS